jgi:hypothetical protein
MLTLRPSSLATPIKADSRTFVYPKAKAAAPVDRMSYLFTLFCMTLIGNNR